MSIEKATSDLQIYYDKEAIIQKTFIQIKKDLASLYNLDETLFPEKFSFQSLQIFLSPLILELLQTRSHELLQSFYRMDLSESVIADCLSGNDKIIMANNLTTAIVNRELKKVIIRLYYSDKL